MNLDFFENKYFFAVFAIFASLYAFQIRPQLPDFLVKLFQNSIFRIVILFLVLVRGYKDPQFSLLVAVAFIVIMDAVRQHVFKESFGESEVTKLSCEATQRERNTLTACSTAIRNLDDEAVCASASDKIVCKNAYKNKKTAIIDMLSAKNATIEQCKTKVPDFVINQAVMTDDKKCEPLIQSLYSPQPDLIPLPL